MKKFITLFFAMLVACTGAISAQVITKDCKKEAAKAAKKQAKIIQKDKKYDYKGSTPLEMAFEKYNLKTGDCGLYEAREQETNNFTYPDKGRKENFKSVCHAVVAEIFNDVRGASGGEDTLEDDDQHRRSVDKMANKYGAALNNVVHEEMCLTKKEPNGKFTVLCYYTVDKSKKEKLAREMSKEIEKLRDSMDKIQNELFDEE